MNIMFSQGAYHVGLSPGEGGQWYFDFVWRGIWASEPWMMPVKNKFNKVPEHTYTGKYRPAAGNTVKSGSSAAKPTAAAVKEPTAEHSVCSARTAEMNDEDNGSFIITSKNATEVLKGDYKFDVKISGPSKVESRITNNGDGTYSCSFGPAKKGDYQVEVTYKGGVIHNGSWTLHVLDAMADVRFEDVTILFQSTDKYGQPKTTGGDVEKFKVIVTGEEEVEIMDCEDGRYTFDYHVVPGYNSIDVQFEGASLGGFPISFDVEG